MKRYYIIGLHNKYKYRFISYIAKLIRGMSKVAVVSSYGINKPNILGRVDILNEEDVDEEALLLKYDVVIYDIDSDKVDITEDDYLIYYCTVDKNHMEQNFNLYKLLSNLNNKKILICDNMPRDSKINERYINFYFNSLLSKEVPKEFIYFNEYDYIAHKENEFDDKLHLYNLSKDYKLVLTSVLLDVFGIDKKNIKRLYKLVERS